MTDSGPLSNTTNVDHDPCSTFPFFGFDTRLTARAALLFLVHLLAVDRAPLYSHRAVVVDRIHTSAVRGVHLHTVRVQHVLARVAVTRARPPQTL